MKTFSNGFSLIELMIIVSIIGMLASVALPAYQEYVARSKMSEVLLSLSACRTTVAETLQSSSSMPFGGNWSCESQAGIVVGNYVEAVETSDEGAIRVEIRNINALVNGQHVMMRPWPGVARAASVSLGDRIALWDCGPAPTNTNDISNMIPASCRANPAQLGTTNGWASAS
jgi:type IV pilus assembly protein PilA